MINKIKDLSIVNMIREGKGTFQAITKVPAGFLVAYNLGSEIPSLNRWKKGALQTIQFQPEDLDNGWLTVFAKKGTKVIIMDEKIAERLEVSTVNQLFYNTNLMDQAQYKAVNAKTWADKVFVENKINELV
jgi:ABC-type glycerol-3-phosphate transport system substrate-binding protein